jgi:hypothetical protein
VAVERVDDDRRLPRARQASSYATDGARFCRVGVKDLRALLSDQPGESDRRHQVTQRRDLPAELVDPYYLDAPRVGDEGHRVLSPGERARDQGRVVAALPQALRQVGDMQRRAAHVEPGNDAQNLDSLFRLGQRSPRP